MVRGKSSKRQIRFLPKMSEDNLFFVVLWGSFYFHPSSAMATDLIKTNHLFNDAHHWRTPTGINLENEYNKATIRYLHTDRVADHFRRYSHEHQSTRGRRKNENDNNTMLLLYFNFCRGFFLHFFLHWPGRVQDDVNDRNIGTGKKVLEKRWRMTRYRMRERDRVIQVISPKWGTWSNYCIHQ